MHPRTFLLLLSLGIGACRPEDKRSPGDSTFAEVQRRGAAVMGVDQYTSRHVFEDLPDGGRVVLERDDADSTSISTIRTHMREIEAAFRQGNFAAPGLVHAQNVPGTDVMAWRRDLITYKASDRPRGAELRLLTVDSAAIIAIHRFLAFQRMDHRAGGHDSH